MSKNNGTIVKASSNAAIVAEPGSLGLNEAVAAFRETFATAGNMLVERVRIVAEYRAANPTLSKNKAFRTLADAIEKADPNAANGRYTGWKYATLERLGLIGDVFAHNGWTLDAHTAHAAFTLVEKNRAGFTALGEGRKGKALTSLDTVYKTTEKADAEKKAATNKKNAEARLAKKTAADAPESQEEESGTSDAITPAALLASIIERVGQQTWSDDELGAFAASLIEYATALPATVKA